MEAVGAREVVKEAGVVEDLEVEEEEEEGRREKGSIWGLGGRRVEGVL